MKRPWMPLYVADYLAKTSHLTAAESGAYLHLLMYYWTHSQLPTDEDALARIARLNSRAWRKSRKHIKVYFDDQWRNPRMEHEIAQAIEISKRNSARAKLRHSRKSFSARHTSHFTYTNKKEGNGILQKQEGFKALPRSPEFISWKTYAFEKNKPLWRQLEQREIEGRAFDFESQWPPCVNSTS